MNLTGHIPDALAKLVHGLMSEWKVLQVIVKTTWKHRCALKGTWVHDGEIGIPCIYFLCGVQVHESSVRQKN